jgi:ubiquinone/menaquinone biosynthesis C-methylase UbiE
MTTAPSGIPYQLAEWEKSNKTEYLSWLLGPLDVTSGGTVLDLGCGSGYISAYLVRVAAPSAFLAIDYDLETLRLAKRLTGARASGLIRWACGCAEEIPVVTASVDHIVCRGVLQLTDVPRAIDEMARVLRENGTLLLLLHSWRFYMRQLSLRPRKWRASCAALAVLAAGLVFHWTGLFFRLRVGRRQVTESFQTGSRTRKVLARHGLQVYREESRPEFLVYARKARIS